MRHPWGRGLSDDEAKVTSSGSEEKSVGEVRGDCCFPV